MRTLRIGFFFIFPSILFLISFETQLLRKIGSYVPFYVVYLIATLKASEFSALKDSKNKLILFSIGHLITINIQGAIGIIGFLMYNIFHEINKRSLSEEGRLARLSYGSSFVAKKVSGEDVQKLTKFDLTITVVALIAAFAFYFFKV